MYIKISLQRELSLYDPALLHKLNFHKSPAKFDPFISAVAPGEPWLKVRPLQEGITIEDFFNYCHN